MGYFPLLDGLNVRITHPLLFDGGHFGVIEVSNAEKALETVSGKTVMPIKVDEWVCVGFNYQIFHDIPPNIALSPMADY
ncbi:hypothetical protein VV93_v1c06570 [Vibrio vulnificus]|uniref:hypothetical protein n=1 Tax=Vibrio vulnificus TaxID=672 RepID=UPI0004F8BBB6|nr:hypothetical protein [Vibrio vulnificus]AIL69753.1 hypothetical protein VV93_v1c06570 [Vibrio vulnificus]PWY31460.1 hypothetical protein VV97_06400 [Vibrio vulnificus]